MWNPSAPMLSKSTRMPWPGLQGADTNGRGAPRLMMRTTIILLFLLAAGVTHAGGEFTPVGFDHEDPERRLARRIEFPDVSGDATAMLPCFSQIERSGKMTKTGCIAKDSFNAAFAAAVMKAAKKARVTPAVIDGKEQRVYLQFRVEFIAKGDDRYIVLYPNPGYEENVEAYGAGYIAAQRVIGKEPWQDVCPQRAGFAVLAKAFVGDDGQPESPSLERIGGILPAPDCQQSIKETILNSAFTPAMADGFPVPSAFVEIFSN